MEIRSGSIGMSCLSSGSVSRVLVSGVGSVVVEVAVVVVVVVLIEVVVV